MFDDTTLEMLEMLPSWMKMRSDPENSIGAKYLNAPGIQLGELDALIENILAAHDITMVTNITQGVDLLSVDILYKTPIQRAAIDSDTVVLGILNEVPHTLTAANSIYDFYKVESTNKYYYDSDEDFIYVKTKYNYITINGAVFPEVIRHMVWGPYDETGLLLGCPRIDGERNADYKLRLLDVFQNPGNATRQGMINYLSRSFSIPKAKVGIHELSDDFIKTLISPNGTVKSTLKEYIAASNKINSSKSNVYWDVIEENKLGLNYLPMIWNVSLDKWDDRYIQSGIGFGDDLQIVGPEQEDRIQNFNYYVGVEGLKINKSEIYPEHSFKYRLYAKGTKLDDGYRPEDYKFAITASELIPLKFTVRAHKEFDIEKEAPFTGAGVSFSDYTLWAADNKLPNNFVTKNIQVNSGSAVLSADHRYVEVLAELYSEDGSATPQISDITLAYKNSSNVIKTVVFRGNPTMSQVGNTMYVGYETNTWEDANPLMRVRNDTEDSYNILVDTTSLHLGHGTYEKMYDSDGDWVDGERINVVSRNGELRLTI